VLLQPGAQLGRYEIVSLVGVGGMGEVYRARDPRLGRDIAIKVLPAEYSVDADRLRRFEQEARAAAALNHPNIVTIHSVEEADATRFFTMELIEGRSLCDLIPKGGMPLDRLLKMAISLVDAVSAAHQIGITHRDLKPANVMVTADGRVKILDFGVAKLREPSRVEPGVSALTTSPATGEGRIVGTVAYMSPEQAEGKSVDQRSDIFSLGVMLYEMATGERPFSGNTSISLLSSIIKDTPPLVTDLKPTLPRELSRIIRHCLVKDSEYRYQSAKDLRNELSELQQESDADAHRMPHHSGPDARVPVRRAAALGALALLAIAFVLGRLWLTRTATGGPVDSLAILPFANVSADPNAEYLSDGITENLINSLSQLPKLRVVPRSTVFRYKGREIDIQKIGRDLTVRAVLSGRVVQHGDSLNVQVDLIDVAGDSQLWGRQYNRTLSDLITVQEEIATEVSERLRLRPTPDEQKRLTRRYTESPEAHQLYLKGRYLWNRRTGETLRRAAEYFQQAIGKDPGYALAWAGLADCYGVYGVYEVMSNRESIPRAEHGAMKALEIDDTLAEAHASLAYARSYDWDWSGAEREFQRAINLNASYPTAHHWYGTNFFEPMGRLSEGMTELKRAQNLDPLSLVIGAVVARDFFFAGRYDEAIEQLRKTLEMDPSFPLAHSYMGLVYEQKGMYPEATAEFQKWQGPSGDDPAATGALGHAYALSGRRADAQQALLKLEGLSIRRYVAPFDAAVIYVGLGDKDRAMEWLEKAYDDHSAWLVWVKVDPRFNSIRDDPRYHDLLRRMRIPE
jgi:serine/threonine protein kinase/tetratricopeptide (TPR) repeat protein